MSVFEPKTLSRTNNPSISFFVWVISHRDDEWTLRAFARFSLSLSLSLFQRPNSSPSLSFTRCAYEMLQRDKKTEARERKQKNVFPNTTKGSSPKTEMIGRTSLYERTTRASSRISTPRWRCCTFAHRSLGLIKARTRSFWRWTVSRFVWVPWWNRVLLCVWSVMTGAFLLSFISLSRRGGSLVLAFFACFFVFFTGARRARERTRRSIFFFLDFFSLWQEQGEEEEEERVFLCFCPSSSFVFSFCSFSFSLSFSFERTKKEEQQLSLWRFISISSSVKHTLTHTTRRSIRRYL